MADQGIGQQPAAGWKKDPSGRHYGRYWDGQQWTDQVVSAEKVRSIDPLPAHPPTEPEVTRVTPPAAAPTEVLAAAPRIRGPVPTAPGWKPAPPSRGPVPVLPANPDDPRGRGKNQVLDAVRGWPSWAKWVAGAAVVLLLIAAAAGEGEDEDRPVSVVGEVATTLTLPVATTVAPTTLLATTISATTQAPTTRSPATTVATVPATTAATAPATTAVYYANCTAVRAAGKAPIYQGQPGYRTGLDADGDGIACDR